MEVTGNFVDNDFDSNRYPNFNLEEYLTEKEIDFKNHDADDHQEVAICCDMCEERGEKRNDTKYRLWVNTKVGKFYCYNCDWQGSMPWLVRHLEKASIEDALKILRGELLDPMEHLSLKLYEEKMEPDDAEEDLLPEVSFPHGYSPIMRPHPYLAKRGIDWQYAEANDWGVSSAGYTEGRIIVPTYIDSKLVFWQARATWEEEDHELHRTFENDDFRKVLNPKGASARRVLYNYDLAKKFETIVLVEGFIDAYKVGDNAMATNGKTLHAKQIELLRDTKAKTIILMWDRDSWNDNKRKKRDKRPSVKKAADMLKMFFDVKAVKMPEGRDPGSFKRGSISIRALLKSAKVV